MKLNHLFIVDTYINVIKNIIVNVRLLLQLTDQMIYGGLLIKEK